VDSALALRGATARFFTPIERFIATTGWLIENSTAPYRDFDKGREAGECKRNVEVSAKAANAADCTFKISAAKREGTLPFHGPHERKTFRGIANSF
jgi:hypothetical protein